MSKNVTVSLRFHYHESATYGLTDRALYAHVIQTTAALGIPSPARSRMKRLDEGVVLLEHVSCSVGALAKLEKALNPGAEQLKSMNKYSLLMIERLDASGLSLIGLGWNSTSSKAASSIVVSRIDTSSSVPKALRAPLSGGVILTQKNSGNHNRTEKRRSTRPGIPHRLRRRNIVSDTLHTPEATLPTNGIMTPHVVLPPPPVPTLSHIVKQLPTSSLPPKPFWIDNHLSASKILETKPISLPISTPPRLEIQASEDMEISPSGPSSRASRTPIIEERDYKTPSVSRKRKFDAEEEIEGDHERHVTPKWCKLENSLRQFPDSQPERPLADEISHEMSCDNMIAGPAGARVEGLKMEMRGLREHLLHLQRKFRAAEDEADLLRLELEKERRKRTRAELIVTDIRREMKEPFIVPSLLDAFISISEMSSFSEEELQ